MTEQTRPDCVEERCRVLEKATNLPLPDAVFAIIHYNLHHRLMKPHPNCDEIPISSLAKLDRSSAELDFWRAKALALRQNAYSVGEALLRDKDRYDAARERFMLDHPGFREESYEAAISFGCFQAR